ncbi:hypothetical protein JTE90_027381 [Oedothorax gibbosus]|uniref:Uncharacterized protein n=1 Tax=Oedothorax gibbosus TaxID=931172 RepID=A0AAV6W3J7_9ARAC|nr:hypothetical protein JTE90_027381 [Oedothorax gibbosus]
MASIVQRHQTNGSSIPFGIISIKTAARVICWTLSEIYEPETGKKLKRSEGYYEYGIKMSSPALNNSRGI